MLKLKVVSRVKDVAGGEKRSRLRSQQTENRALPAKALDFVLPYWMGMATSEV